MTDKLALGHKLGTAVCMALGIDSKNVKRLTIEIEAGREVTFSLTSYVMEHQGDVLVETIKKYNLQAQDQT